MFNRKRYWVIHSSALKRGKIAKLFLYHIIEGIPIIPEQELNSAMQSQRKTVVKKEMENLKRFKLIISPGEFIHLLSTYRAKAIIANDEIEKRLRIRNIRYMNISRLLNALKKDYLVGEKIRVTMVYQNIGYTNDCAKVIVENGTFEEDDIVECRVTHILDSPSIKTLFCKRDIRDG